MIRAKVTIFDDETGVVYDKDKLIPPSKHTIDGYRDIYLFKFEYARLIDYHDSVGDKIRQNNYDSIQDR